MTRVAAPPELCAKISGRAVQHARESVTAMGWSDKSVQAIIAFPGEGQVGLKTTAKYLMYQDRGIKSFIMYWVEGRRIPLKGEGGETHVVTGKGPGTPGWVTLPGGIRKWRDQRWKHPGLKPKRFLEDALTKAIQESRPEFQQLLMGALRGATDARR